MCDRDRMLLAAVLRTHDAWQAALADARTHLDHLPSHQPIPAAQTTRRTGCDIPGCDRPHNSRGLCKRHRDALRVLGDPARVAAEALHEGDPQPCRRCGRVAPWTDAHYAMSGAGRLRTCRDCISAHHPAGRGLRPSRRAIKLAAPTGTPVTAIQPQVRGGAGRHTRSNWSEAV